MEQDPVIELSIHPEAARAFNRQAQELTTLITLVEEPKPETGSFQPDLKITHSFQPEDILGLTNFRRTPDGVLTRISRAVGNRTAVLDETGCEKLVRLAEGLRTQRGLNDALGSDAAESYIVDWLYDYISGERHEFTNSVLERLQSEAAWFAIWIPIRWLHIQVAFTLGDVQFRPLPKSWFDGLKEMSRKHQDSEVVGTLCEQIDGFQNELQGHTATLVRVFAEPKQAQIVAREKSERALDILRIFSGGAFGGCFVCSVAPYGSELRDNFIYFLFPSNDQFGIARGSNQKIGPWLITREKLDAYTVVGLGMLSEILRDGPCSEYQTFLMNAIHWYARATMALDAGDKLVFTMRALESFLLVSDTEPIQSTVAERIAFLIETGFEERKKVVDNFKETYNLRSKLVHHGQSMDDAFTLREFYANTFQFFVQAIGLAREFTTRQDLVDRVNKLKYS